MKIICVGRNYVAHAKELGNNVPTEPVLFQKPATALVNNLAQLQYPPFTNEFHYELEVVLKISKNGKYISKAAALNFVSEITVGIDFTARDKQTELKEKGLPWEKAKAFDGSAFVGKWLPITYIDLKRNFKLELFKNGESVQLGNTRDMIFGFDEVIADASNYFTIQIGDLFFTGTPAGVGECLPGDLLEGFLNDTKMFSVKIK